jgi:hypothetical protein
LPGSDEKLAFCKNLGADVCINYKTEDFVKRVKEETDGKGIFSNIKTSLFIMFIEIDVFHNSFWNVIREKTKSLNVQWQELMLFWIILELPTLGKTLRA